MHALAETEKPLSGDIWFWADDNAKALECFVLPGALPEYRDTVENMFEFLDLDKLSWIKPSLATGKSSMMP